MKCPNCGTANGKTNKFCRECGARLDGVAESLEQQETQSQAPEACATDDVALGEELFGVMRLYEDGDLDAATERINKIIACSPESASAHSIRALVHERKAEIEESLGNTEASHGYLQSAVADYEAIIDLNPDSVADREKLIALRMKLAGNVISQPLAPAPAARPASGLALVKDAATKLPPPVLAAGLTFFVLLVLLIALFPSSGQDKSKNPRVAGAPEVTATPTADIQPAQASSDFKVYTYPTPVNTPAPTRPVSTPETPRQPSSATVPPVRLPSIGNELVIAPEPKKDPSPAKPGQPKPAENTTTSGTIKITPSTSNSDDDDAPGAPDGSSVLAKAIELGNQHKYSEAVQTAQQASQMFQNDLAAGRNTTAAQRGIDNASKYIQLWRSMQ